MEEQDESMLCSMKDGSEGKETGRRSGGNTRVCRSLTYFDFKMGRFSMKRTLKMPVELSKWKGREKEVLPRTTMDCQTRDIARFWKPGPSAVMIEDRKEGASAVGGPNESYERV